MGKRLLGILLQLLLAQLILHELAGIVATLYLCWHHVERPVNQLHRLHFLLQ